MQRNHLRFLGEWLASEERQPLILRGARQVGKTWLIRELARVHAKRLLELNFEKEPQLASLFSSNNPQEILTNLEAAQGGVIDPSNSLLFLDEIQVAPHLLTKLRWLAEEMPQLAVIAAGSLLDFALAEHTFSMPVGRVGYLHLEPFSLEEFLDAVGEPNLRTYLENYSLKQQVPSVIHTQLMQRVKEYLIVGGMPAAVASWVAHKSPTAVHRVHANLLATYRDDFAKYRGRLPPERLEEVLNAIPLQLGKKFVYQAANPQVSSASIKQALELLIKARLCHRVVSTSANGLPLGAERDDRYFKAFLLDVGLCSTALGLSLNQLANLSGIDLINKGAIAEQLAGQLLRTIEPPYIAPTLYYWQRDKLGSSAEVDFVLQHENQIIAIEVKAGLIGKLRSLHLFVKEKHKQLAVRINSDLPSIYVTQVKDPEGSPIEYTLLSIPFYLVGQIHRLLSSVGS